MIPGYRLDKIETVASTLPCQNGVFCISRNINGNQAVYTANGDVFWNMENGTVEQLTFVEKPFYGVSQRGDTFFIRALPELSIRFTPHHAYVHLNSTWMVLYHVYVVFSFGSVLELHVTVSECVDGQIQKLFFSKV